MGEIVHNVHDKHNRWIGPWEIEPLVFDQLSSDDIGRVVIYMDPTQREAGILTSFKGGLVWARYHTGDTSAAAEAGQLAFGIRSVTIEEILKGKS